MRKSILLVLFAVACLALGGVFVRLSEVGPVATGAYRSLFAIPLLLALQRLLSRRRDERPVKMTWSGHSRLALAGVFLALDLMLWNISFFYTTLAESNLLANLVPFVIAPISYFVLKERVPARILLPALLALAGLYILVLHGAAPDGGSSLLGNGLAFATSIFYALFLVTTKSLRGQFEAIRIMIYVSGYGFVVLLVVATSRGEILIPRSIWGWTVLVLLALSSQIGGQTLLAHAVRSLPLQLASVFVLLQPVIAALYALLLFNEQLTTAKIAGIVVLIVAIYWAKIIIEGNAAPTEVDTPVRLSRWDTRRTRDP